MLSNFLNVAVNINKPKFNTHLCTNDSLVNCVFSTKLTKFFDNYLCLLGRSISICTQFIMLYYNRTYLVAQYKNVLNIDYKRGETYA